MNVTTPVITHEERVVAELELIGIHYLSRQSNYRAAFVRPPADLFTDLIRQPSARVRNTVIAVLLAHPEFADSIQEALKHCTAEEQTILYHYYTAAMLLQQIHIGALRAQSKVQWQALPDLFSEELNLPSGATPDEQLIYLGKLRQQQTDAFVNWAGTYHDVARRLLRQWQLEKAWNL